MASRRQFKKELNQTLSEIIEHCYEIQKSGDEKKSKSAEKLIDSVIETFDETIVKLHADSEKGAKAHFKSLRQDLHKSIASFEKEIEKLKA